MNTFRQSSISSLRSRLLVRRSVKSRRVSMWHGQLSTAFNSRSGRVRKSRVARKAALTSQWSELSFFAAVKPGHSSKRSSNVLTFLKTTASAVSSVVGGVTASRAKFYVITFTSAPFIQCSCNAGSDSSGMLPAVQLTKSSVPSSTRCSLLNTLNARVCSVHAW